MASLRACFVLFGALGLAACGSEAARKTPVDSGLFDDASTDGEVDAASPECLDKPLGTPCGSPDESECDAPDTCDGLGNCLPNFAPTNTPCGDPSESECDAPDTCDGQGVCLANHAPPGTPCGPPIASACDVTDLCDGDGACVERFAEDGEPCGDDGSCASGICVER